MSNLLSTLTAQTLGLAPVVQPRVTSRFGPAPLILADAQLALPAPSEPSPWGPPPPGLLSGVDARAPLFSWRQMQDATVTEAAVMPVVSEETMDTAGPTDEALTATPAAPLAPAVPLPAAETTLPRVVEVPTAGRLAASRLLAPVTPGEDRPTTGGDALTQSVPVSPSPARAAYPGASTTLPGETIESVPATQPAKVVGQTETILSARPGAPDTLAVSFEPQAGPGIVTPAEQTGPVPAAVARGDQPAAAAPGVLSPASNAAPDRTGHDDHSASMSLAVQRMVSDSDQAAVVNPPVLVFVHGNAPAMPGNAVTAEPAASIPAIVQRKAEASSLAPVGRAHVPAVTPSSTRTSDPTLVAPTTTQRPVETATPAPAAPDHAFEATLTTSVVDEPLPVVPQPAAETDARTPVMPASAVATTADSTTFAVQPGPAPAPAARAAGSADIARYVSGATPADESRDTAVVGRLPSLTATGQGPAQAAAVTPRTPAPVTAVSLASSGVVDPPGSVPSAEPHAGQPVVDTTALPEPHPSPAPLARASGSPAAALVSTVSPRISTTAVLTPAVPSPAPAAVAGATGPVNPMAPEPNVIPPLAETTTSTLVALADAPVAPSDRAADAVQRPREPSVMTPGVPAQGPAPASAQPLTAQHAAPVPEAIQRAAEPAAAAPAAALASPLSATAPTAPAANMPDAAQPLVPIPSLGTDLPPHTPAVTIDRPIVTGQAVPSGTVTHLAEVPAMSRAELLPESGRPLAHTTTAGQAAPLPAAAPRPAQTLAVVRETDFDAPAAAPTAANRVDYTAALPAAKPRMVETTATAPETLIAAPAGSAVAGSLARMSAAALQGDETPGLAPVRQTQTAAPSDVADPVPAIGQGTVMTRGGRTPALGDAPADAPVVPVLVGDPRAGETTVVAPVADTQAPRVVSDSTVAPGLDVSRPAAANPNAVVPVMAFHAPAAMPGISLAAARPDPELATVARAAETTTTTPPALAAVTGQAEAGGSAARSPITAPHQIGLVTPAPAAFTPSPGDSAETSRAVPVTSGFSIAASAPAPLAAPARGETIGPASTHLTVHRRMSDSTAIIGDAVIRQASTTVPGSGAASHQAVPVPTAAGAAETAFVATATHQASSSAPGRLVADDPVTPVPVVDPGAAASTVTAAASHQNPAPLPGSATVDDPAPLMPVTVARTAAAASTTAASSPAPGGIVANHQALLTPTAVVVAAETAVAAVASLHAPSAAPKDIADINQPAPMPAAGHQPSKPSSPSPAVLSQAPAAASGPGIIGGASSSMLTPAARPDDTPATVSDTPTSPTPYSLLPTPYSQTPIPNPQPLLRITIGRIDVRVTAPPPPASTQREPTRPTVSLDDYLSGMGSPL